MERLTYRCGENDEHVSVFRDFTHQQAIDRLAAYEDTGLTPERCAELAKAENNEKYIDWLENMVILLSKCYQETHDMLLEKAKSKETDAFFNMPTVQGFTLVMMVDKISQKTKNRGGFTDEQLEGWANWLIEKYANTADKPESEV